MKKFRWLFGLIITTCGISQAQQDTVIYDPVTGDYTFQFLLEDDMTGAKTDSLITIIFVPNTKINPSVSATVTPDITGEKLLYHYKITNGADSKQNLFGFKIPYHKDIVVIDRSTNKWSSGESGFPDNRVWAWYGDQGLEPTWFTDGFILSSNGLPSIGMSFFTGLGPIPRYYPNMPANIQKQYHTLNGFPANTVKRPTLVPGAFLNPFVAINFLDTLSSYTTQSRALGWITNQSTADKYLNYFATAKTQLQSNNTSGARQTLQTVVTNTVSDSTSNLTSEAYALLRFNAEYLITQLPQQSSGLSVKLVNSSNTNLTGGTLQYYEGSWKDATNNGDGTFSVSTTKPTVSLRMTYGYGSQQKDNVTVGSTPVIFQTVNAQVKLQSSQGSPLDTGTVQYYAGAWRTFGTTTNGIASKELLANNYSFRMSYAYGSNDKPQDLTANSTVVFQTVNAAVQLKNSQGSFIDQGTVQYYSGAWRGFGTTINGITNKELLPNNYSFRMTYAYASKDKQQNLSTDPTVTFQTVNTVVQLKNSQGSFIDQGTVQYYSGAWRTFGTTTNGTTSKELLPNSYSFRLTHEYISNDKAQDVGNNNVVTFSTVPATVRVKNLQNNPVNNAVVTYYSGAWRNLGTTAANGEAAKELLPANLSFRAKLGSVQQDKTQNTSTNPVVEIQLNISQ